MCLSFPFDNLIHYYKRYMFGRLPIVGDRENNVTKPHSFIKMYFYNLFMSDEFVKGCKNSRITPKLNALASYMNAVANAATRSDTEVLEVSDQSDQSQILKYIATKMVEEIALVGDGADRRPPEIVMPDLFKCMLRVS